MRRGEFPIPLVKVGGLIKFRRVDVPRFLAGNAADDLASAMHYEIHLIADDGLPDPAELDLPAGVKLKPATLRVLLVLRVARAAWLTAKDIGDATADAGHPLKANTIYEACKVLVGCALADVSGGGTTRITQTWTAK